MSEYRVYVQDGIDKYYAFSLIATMFKCEATYYRIGDIEWRRFGKRFECKYRVPEISEGIPFYDKNLSTKELLKKEKEYEKQLKKNIKKTMTKQQYQHEYYERVTKKKRHEMKISDLLEE